MKMRNLKKSIYLILYYSFARYLPVSYTFFGKILHSKQIRYYICKHIFKRIGKNVNIERKAYFGSGKDLEIGDNSGLGVNCVVPNNVIIGKDVMMGPNCYILTQNHKFDDLDIPMNKQGFTRGYQTIIEDNVWIGRNVTMTPGRHISLGSVIGACCLLCKDFPENSIVGGNPSRLIRTRG